jgi:hypothetical protein
MSQQTAKATCTATFSSYRGTRRCTRPAVIGVVFVSTSTKRHAVPNYETGTWDYVPETTVHEHTNICRYHARLFNAVPKEEA